MLSEGASAPSVAPGAPFRDFWGSLGPPVSPIGAPRGLPKTASKIQNRFWEGPWGRQCTFNIGKNALREKTKKMMKKTVVSKCRSTVVFASFKNRDFGPPEGPRSPFQNFDLRKRGLKILKLYVCLKPNYIPRKEARVDQKRTFWAQRGPQKPFQKTKMASGTLQKSPGRAKRGHGREKMIHAGAQGGVYLRG